MARDVVEISYAPLRDGLRADVLGNVILGLEDGKGPFS
jgi:hypothetical protein